MAATKSLLNSRILLPQFLPQIRCYRPRKPLWMGRAKTKMFKVPPIPNIPREDYLELTKLSNNYRTQFKSIREFCRTEYYLKTTATEDSSYVNKKEEEELSRLLLENENENKRIAKIRAAFLKEEAEKAYNKLHFNTAKMAEVTEKLTEEAEKKIKEVEIRAKSFITPENLDEAIEHALENVVDLNYALSPDGKINK